MIKDTILIHKIKIKSSDKHLEVRAIELTAGGNYIKPVNTYIPTTSSCDAEYKTWIGKLIELDDCILVGDFNAHRRPWRSKQPEGTGGSNIASEIDLYNHEVLNEKATQKKLILEKAPRTSVSPAQA